MPERQPLGESQEARWCGSGTPPDMVAASITRRMASAGSTTTVDRPLSTAFSRYHPFRPLLDDEAPYIRPDSDHGSTDPVVFIKEESLSDVEGPMAAPMAVPAVPAVPTVPDRSRQMSSPREESPDLEFQYERERKNKPPVPYIKRESLSGDSELEDDDPDPVPDQEEEEDDEDFFFQEKFIRRVGRNGHIIHRRGSPPREIAERDREGKVIVADLPRPPDNDFEDIMSTAVDEREEHEEVQRALAVQLKNCRRKAKWEDTPAAHEELLKATREVLDARVTALDFDSWRFQPEEGTQDSV